VQHVDLVKNEWLAGFQHVVARIYLDNSLRLESSEPEKWGHLLETVLRDRESGATIDPSEDPHEFFMQLHRLLPGDYLFATEMHDDGECPYHDRMVVPIGRPEDARQAQHA
jgi:hypothetical protein